MAYSLGSLFDGSGGFPFAGHLCGIEPKWASEIEPYPIAVTRSRFPTMKHLGDISKINGAEIDPVDIISFGSPCQDLSVAGKRAGLKHESNGDEETTRSGLFMEAVRIIKEMRSATNGKYPTFALWENVPGAFSSNKGEDFRIVLEELIKICEPSAVMPPVPKNGWPYADSYVGDGWSLAYRVLDAQHWGVPQRRRRIYLVADFGGQRAREVLFERKGLRGHFETGRTPWQETAGDAENCVGTADCDGVSGVIPINTMIATRHKQLGRGTGFGVDEAGDAQYTISAGHEHAVCYAEAVPDIVLDDQGGSQIGVRTDGKSPTLRAEMHGNVPCVMSIENHPADSRVNIDDSGKVQTLTSRMGTGGGNVPMVMEPVYCLQGNGIDRADTAGCNGKGWNDETCYTLNTIDRPAVAYLASGKDAVGTLMANAETKLWLGNQEAFSGDYHIIEERGMPIRYIVRRLTPTECARLQGFPDKWGHPDIKESLTDEEYSFWLDVRNIHAAINGKATKEYTREQMLAWYNKLHTDSSEYKMWGNGIALPCALYVMQGIADVLNE